MLAAAWPASIGTGLNAHDPFSRAPATWAARPDYRRSTNSATTTFCMQSLDDFPDERIVDRGRIALSLHLPRGA
jgi:hypothetical protein